MRAYQFLLEYDRSREQQRVEALPAYQQRISQDPDFSLERLESGDPTPQKIYVPRLAQWWLAGEPTEDLISTTADALEKYHTLKNKKLIKPEHADIGRFKTADQFLQVVDQYDLPTDKPKQDRGNYKEIFRDAELRVIQVLDQTAAKFWGQSTKWCTAAKNNNQFEEYGPYGPLYVIIPVRDPQHKYQYWNPIGRPYDGQFMDELDKEVIPKNLPFFDKLQQMFLPMANHIMWIKNPSEDEKLAAVVQDYRAIRYINNPSEQVQMAAITNNPWAIFNIKNPKESVILAAVYDDPGLLRLPGFKHKLVAINTDWRLIKHIRYPSEELQLAAVSQNAKALEYITDPTPAVRELAEKLHQSK